MYWLPAGRYAQRCQQRALEGCRRRRLACPGLGARCSWQDRQHLVQRESVRASSEAWRLPMDGPLAPQGAGFQQVRPTWHLGDFSAMPWATLSLRSGLDLSPVEGPLHGCSVPPLPQPWWPLAGSSEPVFLKNPLYFFLARPLLLLCPVQINSLCETFLVQMARWFPSPDWTRSKTSLQCIAGDYYHKC